MDVPVRSLTARCQACPGRLCLLDTGTINDIRFDLRRGGEKGASDGLETDDDGHLCFANNQLQLELKFG